MRYFPVFADTENQKILVIGAGDVASRKLDLLNRTHAAITVIAPVICKNIAELAVKQQINLIQREVTPQDLAGFDFIYIATANKALNRSLAKIAKQNNAWVNVVDSPSECNFITPSIVDRGSLVVAISTAGIAPVLARELRSKLEVQLPSSLNSLLDFIEIKRIEVQQKLATTKARRLFWETFFARNGTRFDSQTESRYWQAFDNVMSHGEILLVSDNCEAKLLPLAVLPLFQDLDYVCSNATLPLELNELIRRDAIRTSVPTDSVISTMVHKGERVLIFDNQQSIARLKAHFPQAKHLRMGAI